MFPSLAANKPQQKRSAQALARVTPYLERVDMTLGAVIYESDVALTHLYFPTDCIISMLYVMQNGASAEISVVGSEGVLGTSLFMGGGSTSSRAVVQSAGSAYRLPATRMLSEFEQHGEFMWPMLRYTQSLMTQMAQTSVCNRHRGIDQQLRCWPARALAD